MEEKKIDETKQESSNVNVLPQRNKKRLGVRHKEEFKRQCVQKVLNGEPVQIVAANAGISQSSLFNWMRQFGTTGIQNPKAADKTELEETKKMVDKLKKRNKKLETILFEDYLKERLAKIEKDEFPE